MIGTTGSPPRITLFVVKRSGKRSRSRPLVPTGNRSPKATQRPGVAAPSKAPPRRPAPTRSPRRPSRLKVSVQLQLETHPVSRGCGFFLVGPPSGGTPLLCQGPPLRGPSLAALVAQPSCLRLSEIVEGTGLPIVYTPQKKRRRRNPIAPGARDSFFILTLVVFASPSRLQKQRQHLSPFLPAPNPAASSIPSAVQKCPLTLRRRHGEFNQLRPEIRI